MSVTIRFRGGPFAGELRSWPGRPEWRLQVPSYYPVRPGDTGDVSVMPVQLTHEEYELSPSRGDSDADYIYDWINPAPELRRLLVEQRGATERYRQDTVDLKIKLGLAQEKADKWDALAALAGDLCV